MNVSGYSELYCGLNAGSIIIDFFSCQHIQHNQDYDEQSLNIDKEPFS